jgi:iron complex transport system ATP-binding protein
VAIHDLNHAAMFCDSLVVMQNGGIVARGTPDEVLTEEMLREVFHVEARVEISRFSGKKHIHFL